jgi:deoxyribonuclease-1
MLLRLLFYLLLFVPIQISNASVNKEQKSQLMGIYQSHRYTFFCDQSFDGNGDSLIQNCKNCPLIKNRIIWMAIIPEWELAKDKMCYREKLCVNNSGVRFKGVRCCLEIDENFKRMSSDLYNYVPELNLLKKQRSHYQFGLISDNDSNQLCHFYIDKKNKLVEPSPHLRGMIARTYLYMRDTYQLALAGDELRLYQAWHQQYPVTEWERERNNKIKEIQGKKNPYIN